VEQVGKVANDIGNDGGQVFCEEWAQQVAVEAKAGYDQWLVVTVVDHRNRYNLVEPIKSFSQKLLNQYLTFETIE